MNRADPLDNLGSGDAVSAEIPSAPEDYEFEYPLVSERSKRDLQEFVLEVPIVVYHVQPELLQVALRALADQWILGLVVFGRGRYLCGCRVPTTEIVEWVSPVHQYCSPPEPWDSVVVDFMVS